MPNRKKLGLNAGAVPACLVDGLTNGPGVPINIVVFTAKVLKERLDQKPFRPFRIRMSSGEAYDVANHDAAWVLRDSVEIGLDPDSEGLVSLTRRYSLLHITSTDNIAAPKKA